MHTAKHWPQYCDPYSIINSKQIITVFCATDAVCKYSKTWNQSLHLSMHCSVCMPIICSAYCGYLSLYRSFLLAFWLSTHMDVHRAHVLICVYTYVFLLWWPVSLPNKKFWTKIRVNIAYWYIQIQHLTHYPSINYILMTSVARFAHYAVCIWHSFESDFQFSIMFGQKHWSFLVLKPFLVWKVLLLS